MNETVKEKLMDVVNPNEDYVNFFNDGTTSTDSSRTYKELKNWDCGPFYNSMDRIGNHLVYKAGIFVEKNTDFDSLYMDLMLGLVFKSKDVDLDNNIKPGSKPLNNIVRFYTGSVKALLDGEKKDETSKNTSGSQGYVNYNKLVSTMEKEGLVFNGPRSFKEFKELILSGETFDIGISAFLGENQRQQEFVRTRKR